MLLQQNSAQKRNHKEFSILNKAGAAERRTMARRRFFVDTVRNGQAELSGEDARHLTRVLRVEPGERYEISDNRRVYLAEIETARKDEVVFRILEPVPPRPLPVRVALFSALIKFDRFEWIVEKATELGVESITPVETARGEKGLERGAANRLQRWRRIALEASQQCRRDRLPSIAEPASLTGVLEQAATCRFALDEQSGRPPLRFPAARGARDLVAVLAGPEGGWTEQEREAFEGAGWTPASLGPLVLRAETAAVAALAIVMSAWPAPPQ
jgi:16S rRNA (uracil1498-N3)-methyltransferase